MKGEHNEFKVGLTVTVVAILFIAVLAFIGKWDSLWQSTRPLIVRFHHSAGIQGLRVKDPVRVGGLNVGRVEKIWLQSDSVKHAGKPPRDLFVYVLAQISPDVQLFADAQVGTGTKFVGEGGTLDILYAGQKGKVIGPNDVVDGQAPAGFNELAVQMSRELDNNNPESLLTQIKNQLDVNDAASLLAKIHKSVDDLNAVSAQVRLQFSDKEKDTLLRKIQEAMDNINALTASVRKELGKSESDTALVKVHQILDHLNGAMASARKMVDQAGPRVASAAGNVDEISAKLLAELNKSDKDSLLAKLHASLSGAQAGMENLRVMTQTGRDVLTINRDNLQAIVDNFAETSAHLKATAKEVRRNPWRLLYKPDKPEAEYANLMESARAFSDAAYSLDQANAKLKQLAAANPQIEPNDPQLSKVREEITKSFCEFEQAQKKLWELLKVKG